MPVWSPWTSTTGFDLDYDQLVVVDAVQFPPYTNWRGGIINVEIGGPPPLHVDVDLGPLSTRIPLTFEDLMTQLHIDDDFYDAIVFINGRPLRPASPGAIFGHGFYLELVLRPTRSEANSSEILQDLLRTPSHAPEAAESEQPPERDESLTQDTLSSTSQSDYDVRETDVGPEETNGIEPDSDGSIATSRTRRNERTPERIGNTVSRVTLKSHSSPRRIQLFDHLCTETCTATPVVTADHSPRKDQLPSKIQRRTISLEILIPLSCEGTQGQPQLTTMHLPGADLFQQLCTPWPPDILMDMLEIWDMHTTTSDWWRQVSTSCPTSFDDAKIWHYYTDGSAVLEEERAAWAWALCRSHAIDDPPSKMQYLGSLSAKVILDEMHPNFVGAHRADSTAAEASALFWGVVHSFTQHPVADTLVFHFDALNVGYAMDGTYNYNMKYAIVGYLRMLMQVLESLYLPHKIITIHVKGHAGDPLNELVNTLAIRANKTDAESPTLPFDLRRLIHEDGFELQWLWLHARNQHDRNALPAIHDDKIHLPLRSQLRPADPDLPWASMQDADDLTHADFAPSLNICTFNVRTLQAAEDAPEFIPNRTAYLETQFHDLGLHVVCLQETRGRQDDIQQSGVYFKFRAAASKGHGGVELWFRKDAAFGWIQGSRFHPNFARATILHAGQDLLMVQIPCTAAQPIIFVTGHAPHKGHTADVKAKWWDRLDSLLKPHQDHWPRCQCCAW